MKPPTVAKRYEFAGLPIAVENPAGSVRTWDAGGGKHGYTRMQLDYGYIEGYMSGDGEELDVYIGPEPTAPMVHIVHQLLAPTYQAHDEDKVMLGFLSADEARRWFLAHRSDGERAFGGMSVIPLERFKAKLRRRGSEATTKIHASVMSAKRSLMMLAGRTPKRSARRSVAGRKRAARYEQVLIDRSVALAARALAPDLAAISDKLSKARSFAELRTLILRTYRGMDPAPLGEILRKATLLANLSGRAAALDEV